MPAKLRIEKPNVTASIYGGEFSLAVECPPSGRCKRARFYVEPPEEGDMCIWAEGCQGCRCPQAQSDAIRALQEKIEKELKERGEDEGGAE